MAKSHDDFKDETDRKVREWHEKRAEEKRRPVGIVGVAGTPLPRPSPCREVHPTRPQLEGPPPARPTFTSPNIKHHLKPNVKRQVGPHRRSDKRCH